MRAKRYAFLLLVSHYYFFFLTKVVRLYVPFYRRKKTKTIAFFAAFIPENAGYKWRVEKWASIFEKEGFEVKIFQAIKPDEFVYKQESDHLVFLLRFLRRRFWQVWQSRHFETVIVRRELLPFNDYGNLFLDKLLLQYHPTAILDFDDDIAAIKKEPRVITNVYARILGEQGNKFTQTLNLYKRHVVASSFLKEKIRKVNSSISEKSILVIPTCVDFTDFPAKSYGQLPSDLTLGWIGGDHNYAQLESIFPVLNSLINRFNFKLLIVAGTPKKWEVNFPVEFEAWSLETEKDSIRKMDVGLMPLTQTEVSKGKGGFKLIQYMGLGVVSVASAITINTEIITDSKNAYLAKDMDDWMRILEKILNRDIDFQLIGKEARKTIETRYSFVGNKQKYLDFLNSNFEN